jgi:uncharacterized phage infection (PIP) family protein YhgE
MTDAPTQRVLDRFLEADGLLREAQEHVLALTAARTSAEASAAGLSTAATAVSAYAESARLATEATLQVQEQAARALHEAENMSRSLDSAQLLAAITALQAQVADMQERTDSAAQNLGERLTEIEQVVASIPISVDALGRRVTKHVSTQVGGVRTELEAVREELQGSHDDAVEQRSRLERQVLGLTERLEAGISTVQAREAEEAQVLSGIVDVLPRRSRRRLGR